MNFKNVHYVCKQLSANQILHDIQEVVLRIFSVILMMIIMYDLSSDCTESPLCPLDYAHVHLYCSSAV